MIHLADLSSAQPPKTVDYAEMASAGIRGVYVRLGEGLHDQDPACAAHLRGIIEVGMRAGIYHVLAPSSGHPEAQAARLANYAAGAGASPMPPVVDVERNRPLGAEAPAWLAFLRAYLSAAPVRPILYTYTSFLAELRAAGLRPESECRALFLARYPTLHYPDPRADQLRASVISHMVAFNEARAAGDAARAAQEARARLVAAQSLSAMGATPDPLGQAPPGCDLWQWGGDSNGSTVAGVRGLCDRSYFLGTEDQFAAFV